MQRSQPVPRRPVRGRGTRRLGAISRALIGLALVLSIAAPASADGGLEGAVAATFFPRTGDAGLHAIAHQRVLEISCSGCFNHNLRHSGTAEVIAYNYGQGDPIGSAVAGWRNSSTHNRILSDPSLGRIGCAAAQVGDTHFFVCVLAAGPLPAPPPAVAAAPAAAPAGTTSGSVATASGGTGPAMLPDTAAAAP